MNQEFKFRSSFIKKNQCTVNLSYGLCFTFGGIDYKYLVPIAWSVGKTLHCKIAPEKRIGASVLR